ncbi:MAG: acyl-CoA dehydrogenase [Acidimicrobiaceae bacterium]|nr:acyl-CoA dehydrogenase [Acidimicrobiaceae bacterium]
MHRSARRAIALDIATAGSVAYVRHIDEHDHDPQHDQHDHHHQPVAAPPTHEEFRSAAASFLAASIEAGDHCPAFGAIMPPALHDRARAWQRRVHEVGFAGIHWPVEYGGRGLDRSYTAVWAEECAKARAQPYLNLQGLILAGEAILRSGTDAQKARYLPPTLSGEILWCQLFSEPDAGSDLAGLTTRAVRDGDHYVLNGQKVWCSNGQFAEYGIALARTDPSDPGHRGISFFLLDMSAPGVGVRPLTQMTGDQEFCEVFLDDVSTPADTRLGPEHAGWSVAMEVLQDERGSSGASGLISLERRLAHLASLQGDDPVLGDELLRLLVRGHALKSVLLRSGGGAASASAAKLLRTELEFDAELLEASLRGADGMLGGDATDRLLYAPGMKIAGGSSEIQRNIIGERILGLPREPRP